MKQTIDAVYESGVFKPLKKPDVSEGQQVQLLLEKADPPNTDEVLSLAAKVYAGLDEEDVREIETIALDRSHFFAANRGT